jgi:hypothetical protein
VTALTVFQANSALTVIGALGAGVVGRAALRGGIRRDTTRCRATAGCILDRHHDGECLP